MDERMLAGDDFDDIDDDVIDVDVVVPASTPPSFSTLEQQVGQRRRRRTLVRRGMTGASLVALAFVTLAVWPSVQPEQIRDRVLIADGNPNPESIVSPTVEAVLNDPDPGDQDTAPKIQLYANFSQPVPVFDIDEATQQIRHVGWAESQQRVPVDMKYVPHQQQEAYNTVLTSDGENFSGWDFSL